MPIAHRNMVIAICITHSGLHVGWMSWLYKMAASELWHPRPGPSLNTPTKSLKEVLGMLAFKEG